MDAMTPLAQLQAMPPEPPKPITHDVTIVTTKKSSAAKVLGVPPEEVGVERGARDIKTCNYFFHEVVTKTEGQLIAEGFDEDQIKSLDDYRGNTDIETVERDTVEEHSGVGAGLNTATRLVRLTEHYIRIDYEGNGKPCLYEVITGGDQGEILKKDGKDCIYPIDVIPFATTTPIPIPHRFFGRSLADVTMPRQREKTALKRAGLDNLYLHNNPRVEVPDQAAGPNTLDDLLVSRPGGIVRSKGAGGMINWQVVPDITGAIYPMMQYIDAELEASTGVSKQTQGVDANALQNQSATAVAQVFSASQMRMKLIARSFAEGVRDIFSLLHHTIRSHGQEQQTVRLRNTWVPVDPRQWKTRNDMTINVGLGTGGKAQQFAQMMALANVQKEMLAGGKANLVGDQELFNTAAELSKIMGHKNPDKFFNDPSAKDPQTGQPLHPPVPPPPDPALLKVQADTQMKQQELQMRGQEIQANAEIDRQADERKAQIETVQAQADMATEQRKLEGEMALAQQKFELERELKLMDFQLKKQMHDEEMQMRREQHQQQMQAGVFKVAAGAEAHDQKMEQMKTAPKPKGGK